MSNKMMIGLSVVGTVIVFVLIMTMAGCDVVQQRERGVEYFLGKVNGDVIQPGVKLHAPFVSEIKKYSIAPKNAAIKFSYGQDAAVTKDMQSIGLEANNPDWDLLDLYSPYENSFLETIWDGQW